MIYSRFGDPVSIVRTATIEDVKALDCRKPDAHDRRRVEDGCYLVTRGSDGKERLADVGYLRADGGLHEVLEAQRAVTPGMDPA